MSQVTAIYRCTLCHTQNTRPAPRGQVQRQWDFPCLTCGRTTGQNLVNVKRQP